MSLQTRIKAAGAAAAAAPVDAGRHRAVKRRTKRAVMDRMGYDEVARISAYVDSALARSELRPAVEAALNVEEPTDLATPEREIIVDEILDDVVGTGPLQPLIEDDTVTEIMINGCRSAFLSAAAFCIPSSTRLRTTSRSACSSTASSRRLAVVSTSVAPSSTLASRRVIASTR